VVHECAINKFKPSSIENCIYQSPGIYKNFLNTYTFTFPNDKIKTVSEEEFISYAQVVLPEALKVFSEDLHFDMKELKQAFIDYGDDRDYEAFLNIISIKEDLKIVEFSSRMSCGMGGRCATHILYKKNNNWIKSNCLLSSQGYPYFHFKNIEQDVQKIVTVNWWNEARSCAIK
jgi:hypothetical protein